MIPILEIKNISKKFRIQHEQQPYLSLRDSVTNFFKSPLSTWRGAGGEAEDFWALKDVSFDVYPGESIGIIGKNGAGKSTLLKILSKITPPTEGKIISRGRIASLLEVGTGFHPELSGRENIFLNGSILGMKRKEILAKFDEIVDFSGVEKFLDTPLKHYSSGMQLRLAFAVAAFLEPEILIIDEVLAVGDAEFQKKCLGKMEDVTKKEGRTVLFVSHNMGIVKNLCSKSVLLKNGQIQMLDNTSTVISNYLSSEKETNVKWQRNKNNADCKEFQFDEIVIKNAEGIETNHIDSISFFSINIYFSVKQAVKKTQLAIRVTNQEGIAIMTICNTDSNNQFLDWNPGNYSYKINFPKNLFIPGTYSFIMAFLTPGVKMYDIVEDLIGVRIEDIGNHSTYLKDGRWGVVGPLLDWDISVK